MTVGASALDAVALRNHSVGFGKCRPGILAKCQSVQPSSSNFYTFSRTSRRVQTTVVSGCLGCVGFVASVPAAVA